MDNTRSRKSFALGAAVLLAALLAVALTVALAPTQAYAFGARAGNGAKAYSLDFNKLYTKYDITGDKKADRIIISTNKKRENQKFTTLTVKVNGKTVYKKTGLRSYISFDYAQILRLKNKAPYLYLQCYDAYGNNKKAVCVLLKYKSGKMTDMLSSKKLLGGKFFKKCDLPVVDSVRGNTMHVQWGGQSYALGYVYTDFTYTYKKGKMVAPTTASLETVGSFKHAVVVYKDQTCKTESFVVEPGHNVTISKLFSKGALCAAKIKCEGKTGWVKCNKSAGKFLTDAIEEEEE